MQDCLTKYEQASGQMINFSKSSILFSASTLPEVKNNICDLLGVRSCEDRGNYLSAPSFIGRDKLAAFDFLKERA